MNHHLLSRSAVFYSIHFPYKTIIYSRVLLSSIPFTSRTSCQTASPGACLLSRSAVFCLLSSVLFLFPTNQSICLSALVLSCSLVLLPSIPYKSPSTLYCSFRSPQTIENQVQPDGHSYPHQDIRKKQFAHQHVAEPSRYEDNYIYRPTTNQRPLASSVLSHSSFVYFPAKQFTCSLPQAMPATPPSSFSSTSLTSRQPVCSALLLCYPTILSTWLLSRSSVRS